jgi:hypothetical protein
MALPNGAGGYQVGDGNLNEPVIGYLPVPSSEIGVTAVTLTAAEVTGGILVANPGTTATIYTMPIVVTSGATTGVNDLVSSAKVGSTFEWVVVNIGTSTGDITMAAGTGTGWTIVGSLTISDGTSASFIARKTSDTTWTLYRTA